MNSVHFYFHFPFGYDFEPFFGHFYPPCGPKWSNGPHMDFYPQLYCLSVASAKKWIVVMIVSIFCEVFPLNGDFGPFWAILATSSQYGYDWALPRSLYPVEFQFLYLKGYSDPPGE